MVLEHIRAMSVMRRKAIRAVEEANTLAPMQMVSRLRLIRSWLLRPVARIRKYKPAVERMTPLDKPSIPI